MTGHYKEPYSKTIDQLRAENKRLKGINADLLEACKDCLCFIQELSDRGIVSDWSGEKDLINVIAKCEGK